MVVVGGGDDDIFFFKKAMIKVRCNDKTFSIFAMPYNFKYIRVLCNENYDQISLCVMCVCQLSSILMN